MAVAGVLYYQCSVNGGPCFGVPIGLPSEELVLDPYSIQTAPGQQNPTILALWINNVGTSTVTLSSLSINDLSDGSNLSFPLSVSIVRGEIRSVTVDASGTGFYFTSGHSYSVSIFTLKNNKFTFGQAIICC